jgi:hypothetical protein
MDRTEIAARILCTMIPSPGKREEKVTVAVDYADKLLDELKRTETGKNGRKR